MGSLCGCCRWCLLLLAEWCEGCYGVRVSEALAAYVVHVPFLLVEWGRCLHSSYFILTKCTSRLFGCMSLDFIARGMDLQCHLLGYHGQPFLHYWQTWFETCLLDFVWGVVAESETPARIWLATFPEGAICWAKAKTCFLLHERWNKSYVTSSNWTQLSFSD